MALKNNFYDEIYDEERNWIDMIDSNLLNVYYLLELRKFYYERQVIISDEYKLTLNPFMKSIWSILNNIVEKLDFIESEYKKGKRVNISELKKFFVINIINNNIPVVNKKNVNQIQQDKKSLYDLRKQVIGEMNEDYIDDDFYYENQKVA